MAQDRKDGKVFVFGDEARSAILEGAKTVYDAVTITYGPKGNNVQLEKTFGRPVITRDGVTVARESYLEDRSKNGGAQLLIEASQTTNRIAGDGTTATVALGYHLIKLGQQRINAGVNPMQVKQEIQDDSYKILDRLAELSEPVKKGQLEQVATVSSGDPNLGKLISEAVEKVGSSGGLITEKAPIAGVDRQFIDGYYLQQGFHAIQEGKKEVSNPYVLVTSKPISSHMDILELINKMAQKAMFDQGVQHTPGQPVQLKEPVRLAFFGEIEGDAYNTILANIQQGAFDGIVVKTPPLGEMGIQYLDDLAVYTGGKSINAGMSLKDVDESFFGKAEKIVCTDKDTTIFGGQFIPEDLERRKRELADRIKNEEVDALQEKYRDRLAKLDNKIAKFRIGGATETEREELEFRIEDAIQATRAAYAYGIVPGGGRTLIDLSETSGIGSVFQGALQESFKKLISNAGLEAGVKLNEILESPPNFGFNLREDGKLVDLVKSGVLDPTLVVEQVAINAASVAGQALTIGAQILFIDKEGE